MMKYQNTNWVCKTHRKQMTKNDSKKLTIILQYKKKLPKKKKTILTIASKYVEFSISQELPLLKSDEVSNN